MQDPVLDSICSREPAGLRKVTRVEWVLGFDLYLINGYGLNDQHDRVCG